ncbi:MAG: ATP-binding protein [Muribaculaceae bacterium]|nr:ATP-binding protein [Muribaculaceae bacterium]
MKINAINTPIQFGYNKELNDTVNNKLKKAKRNKEVANHLLEMNQLCNKTEDLLRKAETEKNYRAMEIYATMLVNIKPALAEELNDRFPLLKYKDIELETYKKEREKRGISKEEYHWIDEITDELNDYADWNSGPTDDKDVVEIIETGEDTDTPAKTKSNKCPKYLEEFVPTPISPTGLESVGGMKKVKELLRDKILYPLQNPEEAKLDEIEYGKKYPRGTMFYGPPGCGKTTTIEALVAESKLPMYKLKISKAGSKYINESSTNIQKAYEYVCKVAEETGKPVFLVIDEFESIAPKRGDESKEDVKMVGTLLQIIEEARGKNVVVLGATNKYDMVDEAVRSRLDDKIYVGLPDALTRGEVLKIHLNKRTKGQKLASDTDELTKVIALTEGFSNRDIAILTDKASLIARKDNRRDLIADDFIIPVKENQNMKVKESDYKDKQTRPGVGFTTGKH